MKKVLFRSFSAIALFLMVHYFMGTASASMSIPTDGQTLKYGPIENPELSDNFSQAKPVGFGSVASAGETLNIQIGLNRFVSLVDIYGAFIVDTVPSTVNILNSDGNRFDSFTINEIALALTTGTPPVGARPWKASVMGPVNENLLGDIRISLLPLGFYTVYFLVTPAGNLNNYYLWETHFSTIATETWEHVANAGLGNGNWVGAAKSDGTAAISGIWNFKFDGMDISCPFTDGVMVIDGQSISFSSSGTAVNLDVPAEFQTSPFVLNVEGTAHNGQSNVTYTVTFSTVEWPPILTGNATATRTGGSGITN